MIRSKISRRNVLPEIGPDNFCSYTRPEVRRFKVKKPNSEVPTRNNDATVYQALKNLPSCQAAAASNFILTRGTPWFVDTKVRRHRHSSSTTTFNNIFQRIRHILVPKNTVNNTVTQRQAKPSGNRCENRQNWFLINYELETNHIFHALKLEAFLAHLYMRTFFSFCVFFSILFWFVYEYLFEKSSREMYDQSSQQNSCKYTTLTKILNSLKFWDDWSDSNFIS